MQNYLQVHVWTWPYPRACTYYYISGYASVCDFFTVHVVYMWRLFYWKKVCHIFAVCFMQFLWQTVHVGVQNFILHVKLKYEFCRSCAHKCHNRFYIMSIYWLFVFFHRDPVNIDATDKYGFSPLMQAAQKGFMEWVLLISDLSFEEIDWELTDNWLIVFYLNLLSVVSIRWLVTAQMSISRTTMAKQRKCYAISIHCCLVFAGSRFCF